jgi:hypothetical protein
MDGPRAGDAVIAREIRHLFEKGRRAAESGQFNFAIELFLRGLALAPDNVLAHKELRKIALRRKADGGEDLGKTQKMILKGRVNIAKDDTQAMLTAEQLLAYDPLNVDVMLDVARRAKRAGLYDVATWSERIARVADGASR